jgi:hypothetical protein
MYTQIRDKFFGRRKQTNKQTNKPDEYVRFSGSQNDMKMFYSVKCSSFVSVKFRYITTYSSS